MSCELSIGAIKAIGAIGAIGAIPSVAVTIKQKIYILYMLKIFRLKQIA